MVGRHLANRVVAVLPVADHLTKDDLAPMDVFTVAIMVTVRKAAHFASSSLLQCLMRFLAARVMAAMTVQLHFRAHRGGLTPSNGALCCHPDHYLSSYTLILA